MHVDLGSGDGKGPYRQARRQPEWLFVAVEPNADALARIAWRASRRAERGGAPNLLCVAARAAELARALPAVAGRLSVTLPWGELLLGVAAPEPDALADVAALCRAGASVEVVFSCDPGRDAPAARVPSLETDAARARLRAAYARAGLHVRAIERLDRAALRAYRTTWAGRLAHGRPRPVWRIRARRTGAGSLGGSARRG